MRLHEAAGAHTTSLLRRTTVPIASRDTPYITGTSRALGEVALGDLAPQGRVSGGGERESTMGLATAKGVLGRLSSREGGLSTEPRLP
ncbi:MAG: hypothetical protein AVDCRST_MAG88-1089 [uncultured Thermomicrobiales bacterium]|uniref:Uncharacterized protein n=1 Tax=uncultured Thermomicrobiales bacterium TaxID=1645740 RepID=A0A6J4UNJ4_9BACT|nr:MAG: hypothetical protein AVDCRST_MAG88-1089 [uncultured Thermomicrobiales bacterium]